MKRSKVLAVTLLALMILAAVPVQPSSASGAYSEKLNVFIAGSSAYWYFTFTGVNASNKLSAFESSPGLTWYNITAIKTSGWVSDFQIFGPQGYNLLPVPFIPRQGLFVTLGSDSFGDAIVAAERLDAYFTATLVSLSNESGSFEFYSPLSFAEIVPSTLLELIPSSMGGFAAAIVPSSFENTLSPFVSLAGTGSSSGFSHTLVVGSIASDALDSQSRPNLLTYFGKNITSLSASNQSVSSTIHIRVMDGVMSSKDDAVVTNEMSQFTSSYTLSVAASKKVFRINATVLQQPLQLLAVRNVDAGVLRDGTNMSVSISLTNLSNGTALDNVTFSDNWWNPSLFRLVRDSSAFSLSVLNASQTVTPTYVLQYIGNITGKVTIPNTEVRFSYTLGGSTFTGRAWLNPITISLGVDDAVVYAYVTPKGNISQPVGATQDLNLVVKNVGTRAASPVVADGKQIGTLLADGGTHTVTISQTSNGLLGTNVTQAYLVTYIGVQGTPLNATTNLLPLEFSHSGMELGFATVGATVSLVPFKAGNGAINLTLSFTVANAGSATISHFLARVGIPSGLGCGDLSGKGISCSSDLLTLNYTSLGKGSDNVTNMKLDVANPKNYFIPPFTFGYETVGINFTGSSNAMAVPTGYILTKQFSPSLLFGGASSTVTLSAVNNGPFYIYNATVSSTVDSFDSLSPLAVISKSNNSISPQGNLTKTYVVIASNDYGDHTASPITSSVFFGGQKFSLEGPVVNVSVYQPLNVTITTTPSVPTEGKGFRLDLTISNPASVSVSNVLFTIPVPSGLTLTGLTNGSFSDDVLTVKTQVLLPHSNYDASGVAVVNSGTTISFDNGNLTFVYSGVTVRGTALTQQVTIAENLTTRYIVPIAIALVALVAAAFYVRRLANPSVQASRK